MSMFERWLSSAEDGHFCFFARSHPLRAGLQSAKAQHRPKVGDKARRVTNFRQKARTFYE